MSLELQTCEYPDFCLDFLFPSTLSENGEIRLHKDSDIK